MRRAWIIIVIGSSLLAGTSKVASGQRGAGEAVQLPRPRLDGDVSVEAALRHRRSVRDFAGGSLTLAQAAQLLWAAQGITHGDAFRTAPSAGALYPLQLYVCVSRVDGLDPGTYRYRPGRHDLVRIAAGNVQQALARSALRQGWLADGAMVIVITGVYERTTGKYGQRGIRYVHMEVGHAAQNVYLQAEALGLGSTFVGAFDDERVARRLWGPSTTNA